MSASIFDELTQSPSARTGMFDNLVPKIQPDPEEIEKARERVLARKYVELETHNVKVFDLHDPRQRKAYEALYRRLVRGVQERTMQLWENDRQLIQTARGQRWHRYVEWSTFKLTVEPTPTVGA